jgi:hypothetical protein
MHHHGFFALRLFEQKHQWDRQKANQRQPAEFVREALHVGLKQH